MKHLVPLSAALGLCLLAAPAVFADGTPPADTGSQAKAVEGDLDAAVKAKDDDGAAKAAGKLAKFYKDVQDPAVKASIAKDLSGLVKQTKLTAARRAGLDALVDTDDGATAWKSGLSGAYPNNDADDATKFNVEIVKAVGTLHPEGAIDLLLDTFRKAKAAELSAAAVAALGNYHKSKRREQILEEIYKSGKNMIPSSTKGKQATAEEVDRWNTVGAAIGKALNTLTGTNAADAKEWFKKLDDAKKNYKPLFKD